MANLLIDFKLDAATTANPDGSLSTTFTGATVVPGPGATTIGDFHSALDLGAAGKAACNISSIVPNLKQFCIHVVFNARGPVNARQNLVESNMIPFAIYLTKGSTANNCNLVTSVKPKNHNWNGPDTLFKKVLAINKWYTASLVYDYDTAALFLDGELVSVHAFPNGNIDKLTGNSLFFGTWVDGARDHFAVKWQLFSYMTEYLRNLKIFWMNKGPMQNGI